MFQGCCKFRINKEKMWKKDVSEDQWDGALDHMSRDRVIVLSQPYISSETSAKSQPHLVPVFLFCKMGLIIYILSV